MYHGIAQLILWYLFFTFYLFGPTISPIADRILIDYFFGLSFPPMFCNCITGRWWAVTDHRVWRLIIIYRAFEYVGLSNEYWSTLCILTPGREESSGEYNMHAAGKAQVALLGKWVFECQAESGDMETCIQYKYFWTYTEHIYFFYFTNSL